MGLESENRELVWRVFLWALAVFVSVNTAITGYTVTQLHGIDIRVSRIESSRFTSTDAVAMRGAIATLEAQVTHIPKEIPPRWFLNQVQELARKVERLEARDYEERGWRYEKQVGQRTPEVNPRLEKAH